MENIRAVGSLENSNWEEVKTLAGILKSYSITYRHCQSCNNLRLHNNIIVLFRMPKLNNIFLYEHGVV